MLKYRDNAKNVETKEEDTICRSQDAEKRENTAYDKITV